MEEMFPDRAGEAAAEGTLAHALGELLICKETSLKYGEYARKMRAIQDSPYYNPEMLELMEGYRDFVLAEWENAKKSILMQN